MAKSSKDVTKVEPRPSYLVESSERGQENVGAEDVIIPRLDVIQSLSPQRDKSEPSYIEGAEEGVLFNTVTGELYGKQVFFVPVFFLKEWLIWKRQDAGGGFQGAYANEIQAQRAFSEAGFNDDFEVVDTMNHFGLIFQEESNVKEICISMAKSKAKVSRQLNTLVKMAGGDRFSRVYKITAVDDRNKDNKKYFNIKVTGISYVSEPLYKLGEKMYQSVSKLGRKVAHEVKEEIDKVTEY